MPFHVVLHSVTLCYMVSGWEHNHVCAFLPPCLRAPPSFLVLLTRSFGTLMHIHMHTKC